MTRVPRVYVADVGMITSIGGNAHMNAASVNAGFSEVSETPFLNKRLKPIKMGLVPEDALPAVNPALVHNTLPARQLRMLRLASAALSQLREKRPLAEPLPLFLALPEQLPGMTNPICGSFIEQLILQTDIPLDVSASLVAHIGRAGGLHAVEAAHNYFAQGGDYALIGGVDTYLDLKLLSWLDAEDRLMLEGAKDGFFPGEGAAFLLLASERVKADLPAPRTALARPGFAEEKGHRYSGNPYLGEGLAAAVRYACEHAPGQVDAVWTSMIYDRFGYKELGVTLMRNSKSISPEAEINHPVDCFTDMGAAVACALIGLVAINAGQNPRSCRHLLCCSSELAERAALRLEIEV